MIGWIGVVGCVDCNGLFEVQFGLRRGQSGAVIADESMVEPFVTGIEKEFGLDGRD